MTAAFRKVSEPHLSWWWRPAKWRRRSAG